MKKTAREADYKLLLNKYRSQNWLKKNIYKSDFSSHISLTTYTVMVSKFHKMRILFKKPRQKYQYLMQQSPVGSEPGEPENSRFQQITHFDGP